MKIIPQSHEWITPLNRDVTMQRIERIARTCYQSEDAIKPGSDSKWSPCSVKSSLRYDRAHQLDH